MSGSGIYCWNPIIIIDKVESLRLTAFSAANRPLAGQNLVSGSGRPMLVAAGNEGAARQFFQAAALANRKPCPATQRSSNKEATCCSSSIPSATMSEAQSLAQGDHGTASSGPFSEIVRRLTNEAVDFQNIDREPVQVGQARSSPYRSHPGRGGPPALSRFWRRSRLTSGVIHDSALGQLDHQVGRLGFEIARASATSLTRSPCCKCRPEIFTATRRPLPPATQSRQPTSARQASANTQRPSLTI